MNASGSTPRAGALHFHLAALSVGAGLLFGCPTRQDIITPPEDGGPDVQATDMPKGSDITPGDSPVTPPGDNPTPPTDGPVTPPGDNGGDGSVPDMDAMMMGDGGPPPPTDGMVTPPTDTPVVVTPDVPMAAPCPPPAVVTHTDPCPGRVNCGLPSMGRLDVTGARSTLTEFQVRVTIPSAVRTAIGPMCDRMVFRTTAGTWAPHFVTNCATGEAWVRIPSLAAGANTLQVYYGGTTAVPGANSYDDTFDRVPMRAANTLGAYPFDEGMGARTCPAVGATPYDAFIHNDTYRTRHPEIRGTDPVLWSSQSAPSILAPSAHFTRNQHSLNFPVAQVLDDPTMPMMPAHPGRPINWRSLTPEPFNTGRMQLTVAIWVRPESPSNFFGDNFQTVVCFGMPDQPHRAMYWHLPETDQRIIDNAIFNPWAIFFRGDAVDDTYYQGNTCVEPCLDVISYAHITTREPQMGSAFVNRWHFLAFTFDATATPHTVRRSYFDTQTYTYPADLELFPQDRTYCPMPLSFAGCNPPEGMRPSCPVACQPLCPGGRGPCIYPPEAPIAYPPAPVVIGADLNDGDAQLGINGQVDDMFILGRAASPDEMAAYRERRAYSPDPIMTTLTP